MNTMDDLEKPIGNVEMRLWMQGIDTVTAETHTQTLKTNGQVRWQTKMIYLAMGSLVILAPISGWLCTSVISDEKQIAALKAEVSPGSITAAVEQGVKDAVITK